MTVIFVGILFIVTYIFIALERIPRMVTAALGALILLLFKFITFEDAVKAIDFNTLGLLIGMMILVSIARRSGMFEFLSALIIKAGKGNMWFIVVGLAGLTALLSAFLDNVTTVLLVVPLTISMANELDIDPIPILIIEILASNIGGTATLIGDPPNIMIGSATGLGFMDFLKNLAPVILIVFLLIPLIWLFFHKKIKPSPAGLAKIANTDAKEHIKDYKLMYQSIAVIIATMVGFVFHQSLHLESSIIAFTGGIILMVIAKEEPEDILLHIEWPTIFFFVGLFVMVGAVEKAGIMEMLAKRTIDISHGSTVLASGLILWLSALASAFIDNIPFVATMIPLIKDMGNMGFQGHINTLWWSLALGACLGGNGTLIGASANLITAGMAEKQGYRITFKNFFKIGFPVMIISVAIAQVYILIRYII